MRAYWFYPDRYSRFMDQKKADYALAGPLQCAFPMPPVWGASESRSHLQERNPHIINLSVSIARLHSSLSAEKTETSALQGEHFLSGRPRGNPTYLAHRRMCHNL